MHQLKLQYLRAEWFRGFGVATPIAFGDGVTVFLGTNGSGKSGLVEALEWLLFGSIARVDRAINRQEYGNLRHIRNARAPDDAQTFVEVGLERGGRQYVVRRELVDLNKAQLLVGGVPYQNLGDALGVPCDQIRRPVISRLESRMLLDASPTERWTRVVDLLGLDIFTATTNALIEARRNIDNDPVLATTAARRVDLASDSDLRTVAGTFEQVPYSASDSEMALLQLCVAEGIDASTPSAAAEGLQRLAPPARPPLPSLVAPRLEDVVELVAQKAARLTDHPAGTPDRARRLFLEQGKKLADDDTCPYCGEATLTQAKRIQIDEALESLAQAANDEQEFRSRLAALRNARAQLDAATPDADLIARIERAGASPGTATAMQDALDRVNEGRISLVERLDALISAADRGVDGYTGDKEISLVAQATHGVLDTFAKAVSELKSTEEEARGSVGPDVARDERADTRRDMLRRTCLEISDHHRAGAIQTVRARLEQALDQVKQAERDAVRLRFALIADRVVSVYELLNPGEEIKPTGFGTPDGTRSELRLTGTSFGTEINPVTVFSDGHLQCLALAVAIPCRVDGNADWGFLIVDDPLLGVDPEHATRIAELFARLSKDTGKQIIVTTYYTDLLRDLENIAGAKSWEVKPYAESGIDVVPRGDEVENAIRAAERLSHGTEAERRQAGQLLQDAFELVTDRAWKKTHNGKKMKKAWRIDDRLKRLEELGCLSDTDLGRFKSVGLRITAASHVSERVAAPEEIKWCCSEMRRLAAVAPVAEVATT